MPQKLFDTQGGSAISPLIDVAINAFGAIFIILMIYLIVSRPTQVESIKFLEFDTIPAGVRGQAFLFTFPVTGGVGERKFTLMNTELPKGLEFANDSGTIYGVINPDVAQQQDGLPDEVPVMVAVRDDIGSDEWAGSLQVFATAVPYSGESVSLGRENEKLSVARVGRYYEETIGAVAGLGFHDWAIQQGKLPGGLSFERGRIFGVPAESGVFSLKLLVSDMPGRFSYRGVTYSWQGGSEAKTYELRILPALDPVFVPSIARVDDPYVAAVSSGPRLGDEELELEYTIPGLRSDEGGLSGTPTKAGEYAGVYRVLADGEELAGGTKEVVVLPKLPEARVGAFIHARKGERIEAIVPHRGMVGPVAVSAEDKLPAGLRIDGDLVTGVPESITLADVNVYAVDALGKAEEGNVSFWIGPTREPLAVRVPRQVDLWSGRPVYWRAGASGGEGVFTWSVDGGLPSGLTFSSEGVLTGLVQVGEWPVKLQVRDLLSGEVASQEVTIRGRELCQRDPEPRLLTENLPRALVGARYDVTFAVAGGCRPVRIDLGGSLPNGLAFSHGAITGTPSSAGSFSVSARLLDPSSGRETNKSFTLVAVWPPCESGSPEFVRRLQRFLLRSGYRPGPADGIFGPRTLTALREYQVDNNLTETGHVSTALCAQISST